MAELNEEALEAVRAAGTSAADVERSAEEVAAEFAANARMADLVADNITDAEIAQRLHQLGVSDRQYEDVEWWRALVAELRRDRDEKDSETGDLAEVYARVELALESAGSGYPEPAERLLLRQVIDAAAPLLALRYRREGRLQAFNAITWNTLDVTEAALLDRLYAERCAGEEWGAREAGRVTDQVLDLAQDLVTVLLMVRAGRISKPGSSELVSFQNRLAALRQARDLALPLDDADEEAGTDDPVDDR